MSARFAIVRDALSSDGLAALVEAEARGRVEGCGAVCTFIGVVRHVHQGRRVHYLEYEAYEPMAIRAFERIGREVTADWPRAIVGIHHRIGRLAIGEASVVVAAASPHRAAAFEAGRYAIERVKQIAPVWKHEFFEDGDAWVEGATADPDDESARQEARARACA
jgi:molybdopterin synthase catalytic subunit